VLPESVPQTVVFDTAFHQTMPEEACMFGLPYEVYEDYKVRRYGFHGTSHRFVSAALAKAMGKDAKELKIVSCHLGNGSSITAVKAGESVDTSMGFTPLDGLLMGTRTGSVDPSAVTYVMEKHNFTPAQMSDYMNKKSGLLGISGISSDNRDVGNAADQGNKRAKLAKKMLAYQIKKLIGAYAAAMGGVDAVLFTGGIGENACDVRADACDGLGFLGIELDPEANKSRGELKKISTGKTQVWVVPTNEELLIARDTLALLKETK
jgi:acetate kinase